MNSAAAKADYPALSKVERRHISTLKERKEYLAKRVVQTPDGPASYHRAEHSALAWALTLIDEEFGADDE